MNSSSTASRRVSTLVAIGTGVLMMAWASLGMSEEIKVKLSGDQEVPPVQTSASGSGTIRIGDDKTVSGGVRVTGMDPVAAHIHEAPPGKSGPVIVPLTKSGDGEWSVAKGARLTDAQYKAFKAGDLYVNVHSKAHKDGEIRGQLKP